MILPAGAALSCSVSSITPSSLPLFITLPLSTRRLPATAALVCRLLLPPEAGHSCAHPLPPGHQPPDPAGSEEQPQRSGYLLPHVLRCAPSNLPTFPCSPCLGPVFIFFTRCIQQVFSWRSHTLCTPTRPRLSSPHIRRARAPPTSIAARLDQIQAPMEQVKQSALMNLPLCLYHLYSC